MFTPTIGFLSKQQMSQEITALRVALNEKDKTITHLQKQIECDKRAVEMNELMHRDLVTIMEEHDKAVTASFPKDSFQYNFWHNQYQAARQTSSKHFRWHPTMIKWCLFLRHKSSKAYNLLRKTKVIHLPSQKTLRDYTYMYCFKSSSGFSTELEPAN